LDASVKLALKQRLAEVLINMEEHDLTISSSNADFVVGYSFDALNSLGAHRLRKYKHLVFNLVWAEISWSTAYVQKLFVWLRESHALVISDHGIGLDKLVRALSMQGIKCPQSQLLRTSNCKLVPICVSELDVLDIATPTNWRNAVWEYLSRHFQGWNNMAVSSVPDEQFSIKLIACRDKKSVIMRKSKVLDFEVMLTQPEDSSLVVIVPNDYIWVVSSLAYTKC
jgi:hypothetical protein